MAKRRKTRQEKIIAELRRKLATVHQEIKPTEIIRAEKEEKPTLSITPSLNLISPVFLKKDLTKTFALAILAISLEFVLYFLLG